MNESKKVVTRFAPSPTGFMHIGGVRTALYAWAFAKKHNGTFILRIEDTDKSREVKGSIEHIMKSLTWLNINWNEGPDIGGPNAPYIQSERLESYKKYAQILINKGLAYADPYTEEDVEEFRKKSELESKPFLYRDYRPENPPVWDGTQSLRLKITDVKSYEWEDLVRGKLSAGPEALDDFVLIKSDGYPTYNFAHIIDDLEMGVTHIMRADEFISSTPKFLALYDALGIDRPHLATLPPIMAEGGKKKLGKRDGAKDILDYKDEGYLPQAMINFLAFIGWNPGDNREIMTPDEFVQAFDLAKVHRSGGQYNTEKLDWINREHIKLLSPEEQYEYCYNFLPESVKNLEGFSEEMFKKIIPIITERIVKFSDITSLCEAGEIVYFFKRPTYDLNLLFWKKMEGEIDEKKTKTKEILETVSGLFESLSENPSMDEVKDAVWSYAEEKGRGDVLWPLRVALSGQEKSPDPFILTSLLGRDESRIRIRNAISLMA